jgi:hypothetical protein
VKPPFHEDYASPDVDPSGHGVEEFPFEEVFERLDGPAPTRSPGDLAEMVKALLGWSIDIRFGHRTSHQLVASRVVAALWVVNPGAFEGRSLRSVASSTGISFDQLVRATAAFSRRFGIRSHAQSHAWNYKPRQGVENCAPLCSPSGDGKAQRRPIPASASSPAVPCPVGQVKGKESFPAGAKSARSASSRRPRSAEPKRSVP